MAITSKQAKMRDGANRSSASIDVHVGEIRQLFNSMDPSPFRERDLDPEAEAYIIDSARELSRRAPLILKVSFSGGASTTEDLAALPQAVHEYFAQRGAKTRTALRRLLRTGVWSLLIGLSFVATASLLGNWVGIGSVLHDSFVIGAWVALWRPLEILLYDWWPILADAWLFDRLAVMAVEVRVVQNPA